MSIFRQFSKKIRNFASNDAGNYAMMFALGAPAILGAFSVAVETSTAMRNNVQLQNALDAAALATGKQLSLTTDEDLLSSYARDFFDSNLHKDLSRDRIKFTFGFVENPTGGKRIRLKAKYDYPEIIGFLGFRNIMMEIESEVTAGNRTIEVAIVIDNSGSMDNYTGGSNSTRIQKAREAATNLASQLFALANISNKPDPVKISVVPFASSVNIGPGMRGRRFMDMNGWSSIHHENISWDASSKRAEVWPNFVEMTVGYKGTPGATQDLPPTAGVVNVDWLTRWSLYDALDEEWDGCVEMRPWPHHTTDTPPKSNDPDTLFVPMFAPDEPHRENRNEDRDYSNDYVYDYSRLHPDPNGLTYKSNGKHFLLDSIPGVGTNYGNVDKQNWRQDWAMKYNEEAKTSDFGTQRSRDYGNYGPNMMCTSNPLTTLTSNQNKVNTAIAGMEAGGFTNVQAGIVWGWRTLSNNQPFTQGRDYDVIENDKYIIVLTDGNNTYPNQSTLNQSQYTAWGYEKSGRIFEGTSKTSLVAAMDEHTATTCENIKAIIDADNEPAYKIFTIAYDVADGSSVKGLLHGCASTKKDGSKYYYDVSGDALAAAMQAIGNEISDLRLSR